MSPAEPETQYQPRWPTLWACLAFVLAALTVCLPMLSGKLLLGDDQIIVGYGFREWGAAMFRQAHSIPQWDPSQFGGMPYIAAMHGDIFYPTAWLRWIFPIDTAINLGFALHIILAGLAMYLLLRALRLGWTAAVVGGLSYELTGIVASLVSPGHDGKLYVSALAPLVFLALVKAIRDQRMWGYALLSVVVGLTLLSPQYQMAYYLLVAAGIWGVYLVFFDPERPAGIRWPVPLGLALLAVVLGIGISGIQAIPFLEYIPYSPRGAGGPSAGWEYATGFAFPVSEVFTTILPQFNGVLDHYWGSNFFKLHTEYLGVAVVIPAILAFGAAGRRRLIITLGVIALFFLLIAFGAHTPFYRLWYEVMPMVKKTRAPGMAFYLVALVVCVFAGLGVDRVLRKEVTGKRVAIVSGVLAVFALIGVIGGLQPFAQGLAVPQQMGAVQANADQLRTGSLRLLVMVIGSGLVLWLILRGTVKDGLAMALLAVVTVADLWSVDHQFFRFQPPSSTIYEDDALLTHLRSIKPPFRVIDAGNVYHPSQLITDRIQSVLGYHGQELRYYDDLLGGKGEWKNLGNPNLWDLIAVRFVISADTLRLPGLHLVQGPIVTNKGMPAYLYEQDSAPPYVRVVPAAAKVPEDQVVPTVTDPRFPIESVVLYPESTTVTPAPIQGPFIPPVPVTAELAEWSPGSMRITLTGSTDKEAYLLIAENWYPGWEATSDGKSIPVRRGDNTLISLTIPPGARAIDLHFEDRAYKTGKLVTLVALILAFGFGFLPASVQLRSKAGV
ncbi:MAG: hypothetical protein ABI836_03135 [Gemmatimonadota bacterium]